MAEFIGFGTASNSFYRRLEFSKCVAKIDRTRLRTRPTRADIPKHACYTLDVMIWVFHIIQIVILFFGPCWTAR